MFYLLYCQCCSVAQWWPTLAHQWTVAHQASLCSTISHSLLKFMSIESVMLSHHLILCCSLLHLHSIFPSIRGFRASQFFASGGQSIEASASASVLPMDIQHQLPLGLTRLISLQSKGLSSLLWSTGEEWQPTPVFFPWAFHEQYETFLYRVQEKSLFLL